MKVLILAGGFGTRMGEESEIIPKPMIKIGNKPIIWHIMKYFSSFGFHEFVLLIGYKGYIIKEYFYNYHLHHSDFTIDLSTNSIQYFNGKSEKWKITLLETGHETMTGGRLLKACNIVNNETFMLTYGDGLCNVDLDKLQEYHRKTNAILTVTSIRPEGRYGILDISENDKVNQFIEKPTFSSWVNGGYFVCDPKVFSYIENESTTFEKEPMERLAKQGNMNAYKHVGFWKCMDTPRDKAILNNIWDRGNAPWKIW